MLLKKTKEMFQVLDEIDVLIKSNEEHTKKLINSCVFAKQLKGIPNYYKQLCNNVVNISKKRMPTKWWKDLYETEIELKTMLSNTRVRGAIIDKIKKLL